jgi:hypothetical protein
MLSKYDIDNVENILRGDGDWFSAQLLRLIAKADEINRERIRKGFPNHVALYEAWYYKDSEHPYPDREQW